MGVFPEDFRIPASLLFWLWIAQGFIKPQAPKTLEEIAEEYLEDLVKRNLVMVAARRCNGKIRRCSIHDVPRELGLKISKQDKFLHRSAAEHIDHLTFRNITSSHRHVSISSERFESSLPSDADDIDTHVRSLVLFNRGGIYFDLVRFRLLTVLYGVSVYKESMLHQIFELTNLRLLQFSCKVDYGRQLVVPESISKLQKLETLIVIGPLTFGEPVKISAGIWDIPNLRHLVLPKYGCKLIFPRFGHGRPNLENLQTFSCTSGGKNITDDVIGRMRNLKKLKTIRGDVTVWLFVLVTRKMRLSIR